jgi:hypothetical protein
MELNKKKAELEFKRAVLGEQCDDELKRAGKEADALAARTKGVAIVLPNQRKLDDLGKVLSGYDANELREALKTKAGPAYDALMQRGAMVKANNENRFEIAKLSLELRRLKGDDKAHAVDILRFGAIFGPLKLPSADDAALGRIARLMRRCGIPCMKSGSEIVPGGEPEAEVKMLVSNRTVWVSEEVRRKLEDNLARTRQISMKVQLRNAERQVLTFDEKQENDFVALQHEYLQLLKEQDELLKEFNEEEGEGSASG